MAVDGVNAGVGVHPHVVTEGCYVQILLPDVEKLLRPHVPTRCCDERVVAPTCSYPMMSNFGVAHTHVSCPVSSVHSAVVVVRGL